MHLWDCMLENILSESHLFSCNIKEKKKYLFNSIILVITSNIQQSDKEFIWYLPCYIISLDKCHHFVDMLMKPGASASPYLYFIIIITPGFVATFVTLKNATKMCNILVHCEAYKIYKRQKHPTVNTSGNFLFVFCFFASLLY